MLCNSAWTNEEEWKDGLSLSTSLVCPFQHAVLKVERISLDNEIEELWTAIAIIATFDVWSLDRERCEALIVIEKWWWDHQSWLVEVASFFVWLGCLVTHSFVLHVEMILLQLAELICRWSRCRRGVHSKSTGL